MIAIVGMFFAAFVWLSPVGTVVVNAYESIEGFQGATVKGRIIFKGTVPPLEKRAVQRDAKFCGETIAVIPMQVSPDSHGVSNVVVSIEGITKGKAFHEKQKTPLMNKECRFEPPTQVAAVHATLEISSEDPVLHNTHLRLREKTFLNIALPPNGRVIRKALKKAGRLDVRCDAHKFMRSTIHVFSHPYFSLTKEGGEFEISGVPSGEYQLLLWHKATEPIQKTITVPASGEIELTLDLNDLN